MKKLLLTVSVICFTAGFSQAQAQVTIGTPVVVGAPVLPSYARTTHYPAYYRDRSDYNWRYWDHDNDDNDQHWNRERHDNGKHKGWYKKGRHLGRD